MAKIRTVKPDYWASEQVVSCSIPARLLFIGLWNFCDDAGVHPASHKRLKMEVFPGDDCTDDDIKNWIDELHNAKLLKTFEADDNKLYWLVTGWGHQKIVRPFYKYPSPKQSSNNAQAAIKQCISTASTLPEQVGIGKDRTGINKRRVDDSTQPVSASQDVIELFNYWKETLNHPKAKLDKKRKAKIEQALKDYPIDTLKAAVDGCKRSNFHMGQNPLGAIHDGIDLIFRDAEHVERFSSMSSPALPKKAALALVE